MTAKANAVPDQDPKAAATTVTAEAPEEEITPGKDLTPLAAAGTAAETTADTLDLALATATTTMVVTERPATVAALATPEVAAATEMIAEEPLPPRREAHQSTEEALSSMPVTLKSEYYVK